MLKEFMKVANKNIIIYIVFKIQWTLLNTNLTSKKNNILLLIVNLDHNCTSLTSKDIKECIISKKEIIAWVRKEFQNN